MRTRLPSPSHAVHPGTLRRRAVAVAVVSAVLVALTGPGAAGVTTDPLVSVTVTGTIENIVVDSHDVADVGPEEGTTEVEPFVSVDDVLYALPDSTAVQAASTGQEVVITLAAPRGATGTQALEQAADDDPGTPARVVEVLPVTSTLDGADSGAGLADGAVGAGIADSGMGTHTLTILPVYWTAPDVDLGVLTTMGTKTVDYWREQSAGRLAITSTVKPWAAVATPSSCDSSALTALFAAALAANPYVATPTATNHVMLYFPHYRACGFAGRGSVNGGYIWDNGYTYVDVAAHELGHNLGLGHANTTSCTSGGARVPLSASCTRSEYGDHADVMGMAMQSTTGNLNTGLADALGYANVTAIAAGSPAVTVDLSPLSSFTSVRSVKFEVPAGTVYVDFRPASGRDVRKPAWAGVQVHLRTIDRWGTPATYLLDMQPSAAAFAAPSIVPGSTWVVPDTDLTVTVTGVGATATVRVVRDLALEQYVTRVYGDLFHRLPDPQGLREWAVALRLGTPRIAVANAITASDEYRWALIAGSYQTYLGRGPDSAGHVAWLGQMRLGYTIQQMEAGFLASAEYYSGAGSSDETWVKRLYVHVLGRNASDVEVTAWKNGLSAGGSRYAVAMGFLLSSEHLSTVVDSYYRSLLGRGIDPTGRSGWVTAIQSGVRVEAVIGGVIASDEYFART